MMTLTPPTTISVAVVGACRPTTVARISSERPVSSSARVCLTTSRTLIRATAIAMNANISFAVIAP